MGRQKKVKPEDFKKIVEKYFASITRTRVVEEKYDTGQRDEYGHVIYDYRPVYNDAGEKVYETEYVVPPRLGAICELLGISRETWSNYGSERGYRDTVTRARERIRAWCEKELVTRPGKDTRGIIFELQSCFGCAEKREIEIGERAEKALAPQIPLAEKAELIKKAFEMVSASEDES